jgi:hypothetical protein
VTMRVAVSSLHRGELAEDGVNLVGGSGEHGWWLA